MTFAVIIEKGATSFGAYVPDLPGCIAAAETREEVVDLIREAIEIHVDDMKQRGISIPEPISSAESIDVTL